MDINTIYSEEDGKESLIWVIDPHYSGRSKWCLDSKDLRHYIWVNKKNHSIISGLRNGPVPKWEEIEQVILKYEIKKI